MAAEVQAASVVVLVLLFGVLRECVLVDFGELNGIRVAEGGIHVRLLVQDLNDVAFVFLAHLLDGQLALLVKGHLSAIDSVRAQEQIRWIRRELCLHFQVALPRVKTSLSFFVLGRIRLHVAQTLCFLLLSFEKTILFAKQPIKRLILLLQGGVQVFDAF